MKELKQTNKIFIAGIVFFSLILIGVLTMKKPSIPYQMTAEEAIKLIGNKDKMVSINQLSKGGYQLIDIRNQFDYANGHIDNATNIYAADLFEPFSIRFFKQLKKDGKKVLLYGNDIHEASDPWMILSQLGFDNISYLKEGYHGYQLLQAKKSLTTLREPEKPALDYAKFFVEARKKMKDAAVAASAPTTKKKSFSIRKKKKKKVGGC